VVSSPLSGEVDLADGVIFLGNASSARVGEDISVTNKSRKAE